MRLGSQDKRRQLLSLLHFLSEKQESKTLARPGGTRLPSQRSSG